MKSLFSYLLKVLASAALTLLPAVSGLAAEVREGNDVSVLNTAAPAKVHGRVTGADGNPLVGIAVVLDGTTTGTLTDVDGNWTLDVENPEEAVIVFSCVGFSTEAVPLDGRRVLNLTMKENAELLDEVVVVG